jgi:Flp pilus assembly protein TadG
MNAFRSRSRRLAADEGGGVAIEFAIVSMAFILVTLGIIEFGRALQARNEMAFAADFAARQIMIDPEIDEDAIEAAVAAKFDGHAPDTLVVDVTDETVDGEEFRVINMTYPMNLTIPGTHAALTLAVSRRVPKI